MVMLLQEDNCRHIGIQADMTYEFTVFRHNKLHRPPDMSAYGRPKYNLEKVIC